MNTDNKGSEVPLLVDLDGSLIRTDTLHETCVLLLKQQPWMLFFLPFWLLKGKHYLKRELYERANLNAGSLPYNQEVVHFLSEENEKGRKIILCTGTWVDLAKEVAGNFSFFDDVVASDEGGNLTGSNKAQWAVDTYGESGFDYLGNSQVDLKVWNKSRRAVVVSDQALADRCSALCEVERVVEVDKPSPKIWLKAIRVHQWAKNSLLFVPLLTSHHFDSLAAIYQVLIAFVSFGLCASATYLLNDLFDLEADRKHQVKCNRPLAAGKLSIPSAVIAGSFMLLLSILLAIQLGGLFTWVLFAYLVITVLYSFKLKRQQTVDVIVLASLFTIRVVAGAVAIDVLPSFWLLCFSMFMFLSLALVKRVAELIRIEGQRGSATERASGRGYFTADIVILQCLGSASGFLAVLVFALYINTEDVIQLYSRPEILWLMCPVLGYWIMRVWMLTARDQMNEDPIYFAIKDKNSWLAAALVALVFSAASWVG